MIIEDADVDIPILNARMAYEFWINVHETCEDVHAECLGLSMTGVIGACEQTQSIDVHTFDNERIARTFVATMEADPDNITVYHIVGSDVSE